MLLSACGHKLALAADPPPTLPPDHPKRRPSSAGQRPAADRSRVTDQDRKWWAFQPLSNVQPPTWNAQVEPVLQPGAGHDGSATPLPPVGVPPNNARGAERPGHPIDRFLSSKAAQKGLALSPPADRRTLVRRAYLDLLGLPPKPSEVQAFLDDAAPEAWPRLLDRLLASPQYGERWGRYWLDVARFAESSGFEHDYDREGAYQYRDFVIKALNADLPFDQFLHWQIAGDEFEPDNPLALAATGFLGAGVFPTQITANEVERTRYDALDDMLATTSSAFLGLTVGCARCHDHKYDPIPSRDYYRILATFTTTVRSVIDIDTDPAKTRKLQKQWEVAHASLWAQVHSYEDSLRPQFADWLDAGEKMPGAHFWSVLDSTNLVSKAGATFERLADGSFLARGKNADHDEYTFIAPVPVRRLTGLRLEALADPSLPKGGPGRADNGNIGLSRIRVFLSLPGSPEKRVVELSRPQADFEQNQDRLSIAASLDDDPSTGWAVDPQFGKDHAAVFTLAEPIEVPADSALEVKLEFAVNTRHNLGRPRFSVTDDPSPSLEGTVLPETIATLLRRIEQDGAGHALTAADRAQLFKWWKQRDAGWQKRSVAVEDHSHRKPDARSKMLICAEGYTPLRYHTQGADFFKETYFLKRGSTDLKDGVASPGFLQVLDHGPEDEGRWEWTPPPDARFSGRRRTLANWLTDIDQGAGALVARVAVNRLWQHHFGQGLVSTPNDFGHAGNPPSQPELLDWLAGELVRHAWRLKPLHKLLMTSAAYQQACVNDAEKEKADPANQLFVRRAPQRLEGEAIRDSMLAVAGLLDLNQFGPGTKDERSHRRSIYFTVKRSQLIGSMVVFDQPEPLVSQGLRPTTTVAPQALLLLNGPQVREWAAAFAQRVEQETRNLESALGPGELLIQRAYIIAIGRLPSQSELRDSQAFLERQTRGYAAEGQAKPESLALTDFCQVLFGLNEFIYEN